MLVKMTKWSEKRCISSHNC